MKLIVSVPSQYGSPVLKSLFPQLVSVQSARRFFLFAFRIPGQHHGPKLRDHPLRFLKRPALVFFEFFLFLRSPLLSMIFGDDFNEMRYLDCASSLQPSILFCDVAALVGEEGVTSEVEIQ
ncbi:uncharacterized protein TNCV_2715551 [Trichonephila clavipes]|nr:uncharacterized protein TNCV_2715551 [Trichonephila clavipes]